MSENVRASTSLTAGDISVDLKVEPGDEPGHVHCVLDVNGQTATLIFDGTEVETIIPEPAQPGGM